MANASAIINDDMTLEEKLSAIDAAMAAAQATADDNAQSSGGAAAPIDPQDFLMCEGCQ
ncbi:MAG: hypothetical protein UW38_C0001G0814 [Candidatus Saccharibacteria bacterium GW2011_GWC2_44_17]|nr:MAG: hypothetical protein UW38_C0001G0814 [Candidatus Saccharibacteria bacterium GW2011_GWC2_44_17]MBH1956768.1 hypothetical protein [Candidatus Saccharibacteria bacterium]MBH1973156.1 hypothetical protein [Candidatus Saccharibacteria bacterium]MBH1990602.1 hypothetical protein [Candidatus Saccharibacteria bacterium]